MHSDEDNLVFKPESVSPTSVGELGGNSEELDDFATHSYDGSETAALQELVKHSIGAMPVEIVEPLPDPETIEKISSDKIKSMRQLTVSNAEILPPFKEQLIYSVIQTFSHFKTLIFPPPKERRYCELKGHECKHCGELVESTTQQKQREKAEKSQRH
jgi:hypothetical protein